MNGPAPGGRALSPAITEAESLLLTALLTGKICGPSGMISWASPLTVASIGLAAARALRLAVFPHPQFAVVRTRKQIVNGFGMIETPGRENLVAAAVAGL